MATRSRGTSDKAPKKRTTAAPPATGEKVQEAASTPAKRAKTLAKQRQAQDAQPSPPTEVTRSTLQRRELPSLSDSRAARIAEAAYWRAERRGFAPGRELDDWLEAEREIDDRELRSEEEQPAQRRDGR
jgi:Protein of unknown function (DUF2934)